LQLISRYYESKMSLSSQTFSLTGPFDQSTYF